MILGRRYAGAGPEVETTRILTRIAGFYKLEEI